MLLLLVLIQEVVVVVLTMKTLETTVTQEIVQVGVRHQQQAI